MPSFIEILFMDWSTHFLYWLGNKVTRVTCKFVKRDALLKFLHVNLCHFIFQSIQKMCISIHIFMLKQRILPLKSRKSKDNFPARDPWHSFENICHGCLMLHCRRMPRECKYQSMMHKENWDYGKLKCVTQTDYRRGNYMQCLRHKNIKKVNIFHGTTKNKNTNRPNLIFVSPAKHSDT